MTSTYLFYFTTITTSCLDWSMIFIFLDSAAIAYLSIIFNNSFWGKKCTTYPDVCKHSYAVKFLIKLSALDVEIPDDIAVLTLLLPDFEKIPEGYEKSLDESLIGQVLAGEEPIEARQGSKGSTLQSG